MLVMARISCNFKNTNSYSWQWKPTDYSHICTTEENSVSSSKKLGPDIELIITSLLNRLSKYLLFISFIQDNLFIVSLPNPVKLLSLKPNLNIQFHYLSQQCIWWPDDSVHFSRTAHCQEKRTLHQVEYFPV